MPWKGWNEHEVRPQRQAATSHHPAAMGFTAINSSSPAPQSDLNKSDGYVAMASPPAPSDQTTTVASEYLGRGNQDVPAAAAAKPAPKKTTGKGKKRIATAPAKANTKRRKTSDVADSMPTAKTCSASKKAAAIGTKKKASRQEEADPTSAFSSVSVVAPSTLMGTLNGVSQQTSFDAVKSAAGHGTVIYNRSTSPSTARGSTKFSRPLLDQVATSSRKLTTSTSYDEQPRSCDVNDDYTFDNDDEDFGTLFDEMAQQIEGSTTQQDVTDSLGHRGAIHSTTRRPRSHATPKGSLPDHEDDYFFENYDKIFENVLLAEQAASVSKTKGKRAKAANTAAKRAKQLPTSVASGPAQYRNQHQTCQAPTRDQVIQVHDDDEDGDMIEFEKAMKAAEQEGLKPRSHKQNIRHVSQHEDYGGGLLDEGEKQLLDKLKSASLHTDHTPIVRNPFPKLILDRSPIFGASNTTILRTCFRLGEALNVGSQAVRNNKNAILEIYARITSSFRDGRKQHLIFHDLYHDKPPHLEGDFELWNQSRLWELDGRAFLQAEERAEGVMCRAIARMKRNGTKWRLEVSSIWEAGWEDVEAVAGIYRRGGVVGEDDE